MNYGRAISTDSENTKTFYFTYYEYTKLVNNP